MRTTAGGITARRVFRAINKAGRIWGDGMSPKVLWDVVRVAAPNASRRYLGCKQKLRYPVNDRLGIEPDAAA